MEEFFQDAVFYDEEYKAVYENVFAKTNLTCSTNIKLPYYSAGNDPIFIDCGAADRLKINSGKYPICDPCIGKNFLSIDERAKWKKSKKNAEIADKDDAG